MLDQSYISIFKNLAEKVTIAYAASGDDESSFKLGEVEHITIEVKDLDVIANALLDLAKSINED